MRNEGVADIARQLGCSQAYVSMVMSGKKKPSKRLAILLGKVKSNYTSEHKGRTLKSVEPHGSCGFDPRPRQDSHQGP